MDDREKGRVIPPGGGKPIRGMNAYTKIGTDELNGRLFIFEGRLVPGHRIPSHTHSREDEVTIVVSGTLQVEHGGTVSVASAGSVVLKPRNVPHSMWNESQETVTVLEVHTPGLLEPYYDALGELFIAQDMSEDRRRAAIQQLQERYGIVFHGVPAAGTR